MPCSNKTSSWDFLAEKARREPERLSAFQVRLGKKHASQGHFALRYWREMTLAGLITGRADQTALSGPVQVFSHAGPRRGEIQPTEAACSGSSKLRNRCSRSAIKAVRLSVVVGSEICCNSLRACSSFS